MQGVRESKLKCQMLGNTSSGDASKLFKQCLRIALLDAAINWYAEQCLRYQLTSNEAVHSLSRKHVIQLA